MWVGGELQGVRHLGNPSAADRREDAARKSSLRGSHTLHGHTGDNNGHKTEDTREVFAKFSKAVRRTPVPGRTVSLPESPDGLREALVGLQLTSSAAYGNEACMTHNRNTSILPGS